MVAFLVLETLMTGVFCALDLVLFYLFFEGGLIPMFLIIGIWGGRRRVYASFKFFLYTLAGSLLMLLADHGDVWRRGHNRHRYLAADALPLVHAKMAVARVLRLARRQDADVAGPYLASRRACRSADRGVRHPCRHPPQNGRLWLHPLLAADVPGGVGLFRAARFCAVDHRDHLYLARCPGAGGYEEAHRLFLGGAYGLRDDGPLQHDPARRAGRGLSDDLAWPRLRRPVSLRRCRLRSHAYPRHRGLWRSCRPHAALCGGFHDLHPRQCRLARAPRGSSASS